MDFGGGFATGIAVGMGSGVASGMASGKSQAKKQIQEHIDRNGITIHDRFGKPVKPDDFLNAACGCQESSCSRGKTWAIVAVGLAVLAAAGVAMAFVLR